MPTRVAGSTGPSGSGTSKPSSAACSPEIVSSVNESPSAAPVISTKAGVAANSPGSLGSTPSRTSPPTAVGEPANTKASSGAGPAVGHQAAEHEGDHLDPVQRRQRPAARRGGARPRPARWSGRSPRPGGRPCSGRAPTRSARRRPPAPAPARPSARRRRRAARRPPGEIAAMPSRDSASPTRAQSTSTTRSPTRWPAPPGGGWCPHDRGSRSAAGADQVVLEGEGGGRGPGRHADLGEDVRQVAGHRLGAEEQLGGDLVVGDARRR